MQLFNDSFANAELLMWRSSTKPDLDLAKVALFTCNLLMNGYVCRSGNDPVSKLGYTRRAAFGFLHVFFSFFALHSKQ